MNWIWSVLQLAGLLAVLVGAALALPLWAALVVDGVLVVAAATAVESVVRGRPGGLSDGRGGPRSEGVA